MNKKIFFIILFLIIFIPIASSIISSFLNNNKDEQFVDIFSKAKLVEIYTCSSHELIASYQNKHDIAKLIKNLNVEKWDICEKKSEDSKKYLIQLYQKPIKTLFNNQLKDIGTIAIYNSGEYVDFSNNKLNLTFKTNKDISSLLDQINRVQSI